MRKKALCVGINEYHVKPLRGCVNDANDWAGLLVERYDFPRTDVAMLVDAAATRRAIIDELKNLLARAQSGDVLVFVNASHGAEVMDKGDGDESIDEAICPVDFTEGVIVDDELRELVSTLPAGVNLAVVADSCHSGTLLRDRRELVFPSEYDSRERFLDWDFLPDVLKLTATAKKKERYPEEGMREILLAGCRDSESSHDARFGERYQGVMSSYALQAIRDANYRLTYAELGEHTAKLVARTKFSHKQHPQLEGRAENKARQIFT